MVVTDGEDAVDAARIETAWAALRGLPVCLRVLCLGDENPWLKGWVARQRAAGRDAGWLHLDDASLAGMPGDFDFRPPTLLPGPERWTGSSSSSSGRTSRPWRASRRGRSRRGPRWTPPGSMRSSPRRQAPSGEDDAWTVDALEAIAEAASLAPFEERAGEAVVLLEHLLAQREVPVAAHLTRHARPGPRTADALRRLRLLCRPAG